MAIKWGLDLQGGHDIARVVKRKKEEWGPDLQGGHDMALHKSREGVGSGGPELQ